jgi:phosphinothricin acetyltransferase
METKIRLAEESDAEAIRVIYNHYVLKSTCTFDLEIQSIQHRLDWLRAHDDRHPVTVCCLDQDVIGWASITRWHPRPAYAHTAEVSVYIDHRWHRRGIGRSMLVDLIDRAQAIGFHVLIGGVCTEQVASLELHQSLGFVEVARYTEVGRKFDRWLDVAYLQRIFPENG